MSGAKHAATPLVDHDATGLVEALGRGDFTVSDVARAYLERIDQLDPRILAWAHVNPDFVLRQAEGLEAERSRGPLFGVPIGVKDIFNTLELPTQMGSPLWKDFTPGNDARTVFYLRRAGAMVLGKTTTAEFAVHAPSATHNPHRRGYMPGTSSSGSAAAVAAAMCPVALGTQTAGSIIRPASYCGVYGYKPSFGTIPRTGMLKTTDSLDTVGFFTRSPRDLGLVFDTMRVKGRDFPVMEAALNDPARQRVEGRPWRVGVVRGPTWKHAEDHAQDSLLELVKDLEKRDGIELTEVTLPSIFDEAHAVHATIYDRCLAYYFKEEFSAKTLISPVMYELISQGAGILLEDYLAACEKQNVLARELDRILSEECDVLLGLSTGGEALEGLDSVDRPDNCLIWTMCWAPAISIPRFVGPSGLPYGLQVVARRYSDYKLLDFVRLLEREGVAPSTPHPHLGFER